MPEEQGNKILIVGENFWQQRVIENALGQIFKNQPKIYIKSRTLKEALPILCANQSDLYGVFCYHNDRVNGVQLLENFQSLEGNKPVLFVLLVGEKFSNIIGTAERMGIVCAKFPAHPISSLSLAKLVVEAIVKKSKEK